MAVSAQAKRVVLVVCDRLTWEDLEACPFLLSQRDVAAVGVMNDAVPEPKSVTSAVLTLAMGQTVKAEAADERAFGVWGFIPSEENYAEKVYKQRWGHEVSGERNIVHLNVASLAKRHLLDAGMGAALARAGKRTLVCGNADSTAYGRRAALLVMDDQGTATGDIEPGTPSSHSSRGLASGTRQANGGGVEETWERNVPFLGPHGDATAVLARFAAHTDAPLFVVQLGDLDRVETTRATLPAAEFLTQRKKALQSLDSFFVQLLAVQHLDLTQVDLMLISSCPPNVRSRFRPEVPGAWPQLTPVLAFGPDFPTGLLTSATTRTPGLVANTDVAPTILTLLDTPIPSTMVGRPISVTHKGANGVPDVARIDFVTILNADSWLPAVLPIGLLSVALILATIVAYWRGGTKAVRWLRPSLVFILTMPAAFLLCTILIPPTVLEYGLRMLAWMLALTAICYGLARILHRTPPVACALLTTVLLVFDICVGQPLLKSSLVSNYALGGVRYYGVGNEYLGVLLAYALLALFAWNQTPNTPIPTNAQQPTPNTYEYPIPTNTPNTHEHPTPQRPTPFLPASILLLLAFILGWPTLGANSGSLIVTGAGFTVAVWGLAGRRFRWSVALMGLLLGIGLSVLFAVLDARLSGGQASHAGHVLNATTHGRGAGYMVEIMVRKVGMNLRMLVQPYYLLGVGALASILLLLRNLLGSVIRAMLVANPRLHESLAPLGVTLVASLIFKDSGVVTAAFLAGLACLFLLWYVCGTDDAATHANSSQ